MIQDVSDTALWVAHFRAEENERPDALFHDPYAGRLAGMRGREIAESMVDISIYTRWTVVIRTVLIDRFVERLVSDGVDLVLNLGAGLDARPYRMALPESLQWIEVDHARIIDHKERVLGKEEPNCRLERVRLDLADRNVRKMLFADVSRRAKNVLVITEGLLPYLTEDQVSELAQDLRESGSFRYWIAEYFSKEIYRFFRDKRMKKMANAPFQFQPEDWLGFFRARGWVKKEIRFVNEDGMRLGRRFPMPWWGFLVRPFMTGERGKRFMQMTGFVIFERES